ncbi:trypsin-like peptidase domain-containing protein [Streptomyces mobaraensis NBRC 13819 = DSM 40847]|nr:trypsin-like peptidase domain-containing protein [Streptomyces mobaraensis NBRC 13819 = DSM 40847]
MRPPARPERAASLPGDGARHRSAPATDVSEPDPATGAAGRSAAAQLPHIPAEPASPAPTAPGPAGTVPGASEPSTAAPQAPDRSAPGARPSRPVEGAPAPSSSANDDPHTTTTAGHVTEPASGGQPSADRGRPSGDAPDVDAWGGSDARRSAAPAPGEQASVPGQQGAGPQVGGEARYPHPYAPVAAEAAAGQQPGGGVPHPPGPAQGGAPAAPHPYAPAPAPLGYGPGAPAGPVGPWQYDPWAGGAAGSRPPEGTAAGKPVSRSRLVAGALVVALVAGGIGGGIGAWLERDGGPGHRVTLPQAPADKSDRDPGSIAGIAARALPGVVTLHVRGSGGQGTGTGFVLDGKGHILTNNHVVEPAGSGGEIQVTFNGGQTAKATVVGRDSGYDLAVVKVKGVSGLTPLPLGNSDSVHVGDSVVAIGAPFDLAGTVTTGIISAKARPITAGGKKGDGTDVSYVDALQTDAPINPGNSGGPLVDSRGRVIGINSAIRSAGGSSESGGQGGSIGLGFAIPINQAKRVAEELINTGRATHPVIGVSLDMEYQGDGARVNPKGGNGTPVTPGGPADKAGIAPGDVIKKVDDVPVRSGQELIVKIRSHRPGDRLTLTVERDGKERTVRMTLGTASSS